MNRTKSARILRPLSFICALLAALLQTMAVFADYHIGSNYFASGAVCPTLAVTFALLGTALGIAAACLTAPNTVLGSAFQSGRHSLPAAIGFLTASIFSFLFTTSSGASGGMISTVAALFLLIGAVYCLLSGSRFASKRADLTVLLGFFAVLGPILLIACYYFDASIEMNAPLKLSVQMGLLCIPLYYTGELRYLLGRQQPRIFSALCSLLLSIGALGSIPVLVTFFFGKINRADLAAGALLIFCTMCTAMLRMWSTLTPAAAKENEEVEL